MFQISKVQKSVEEYFDNYKIELFPLENSITISIYNKNNKNHFYQSNFTLEQLHKNKLLVSSFSIQEIIDFISNLIKAKNVKIEENEKNNYLKFILISTLVYHPNVELILKIKGILIKENIIEKILNENTLIKNSCQIDIENLKKRIKFFEKENTSLKELIIKNDNLLISYEKMIDKMQQKMQFLENNNYNDHKINNNKNNNYQIINECNFEITQNKSNKNNLNNKGNSNNNNNMIIDNLDIINMNINKNNKNNHININTSEKYENNENILEKINEINLQSYVTSMSIFPSGKIVFSLFNNTIKITEVNFSKIIQLIEKAHNDFITYISIKDENNFVSCSKDKNIKTWKKEKNNKIYVLNKIIKNAHEFTIKKILYYKSDNLISCSLDQTIKIWKENNNNSYDNIQIIYESNIICSILLLEEKKILISSAINLTKFYSLNNYQPIFNIEKTYCGYQNALCNIDNNKIIVQGENNTLKIISINEKKVINLIKTSLLIYDIHFLKEKQIFVICGIENEKNNSILIYKYDNLKCIQNISNSHSDKILGLIQLKNGNIVSYSKDKKIQVWDFIKNN